MAFFNPGMMVWNWISKGVKHLLGSFSGAATPIAAKVLATFGLTMISFDAVLPPLKAAVLQSFSGLSGPAADLLGYLGVAQVMSMIFSALTVRLAGKMFIAPKAVADSLPGGGS